MEILPSFTHPHAIQTLYDALSYSKHKENVE